MGRKPIATAAVVVVIVIVVRALFEKRFSPL
jgi:hypothetical protein